VFLDSADDEVTAASKPARKERRPPGTSSRSSRNWRGRASGSTSMSRKSCLRSIPPGHRCSNSAEYSGSYCNPHTVDGAEVCSIDGDVRSGVWNIAEFQTDVNNGFLG
jgi:hypothetical protein